MCRLLSTITLSYRDLDQTQKSLFSSCPAPGPLRLRWPEPSFLRCCRALSGPARLPGPVRSHHDPTQQLRFLCRGRSWTSFLPGTRREPPTSWAGRGGAGAGAMAGPGGVTSPGSWEQEQGKPRRPSYYIQCRGERSGRALAALIPLPGRQPRRSS